ncbi:MAG: enoyl-CoA hydratase/isomerase family protein [Burkholderiales bacterium]
MSPLDPILVDVHQGIAVVRLNRPDSLNAIDQALRGALVRELQALDANEAIGAVVLTGAGSRAFSGGQDLAESAALDAATVEGWLDRQHAMYQAVRDVRKPIVAALNGTTVGAGFQIALLCDLRIGHANLRMGQPEVKAGLASIVGSYLMSLQIGHSLNQELSLSGELISGARAYQLGLVNGLAEPEQVLAFAIQRAQALANLPQTALRATKRRFRDRTQAGFEEACRAAAEYQLECYASGEPQRVMAGFLARHRRSNQ